MPSTGPIESTMRFLESDNGQRLAIVVFSVIANAVLWVFPDTALAYIFGIPLLFFIPGFAVVRLFFWKATSPEAKFVLSLGLSILVLIFLALILVFSPPGLTPDTARASVVLFAIGAVGFDVLWKRPEMIESKKAAETAPSKAPRTIKLDKVVASMLGTAIAISVLSIGLILTADYPSRTYFAVTDDNGSIDINATWEQGTTMDLVLHMKNGEGGARNFRVVVHNDTLVPGQEYNRMLAKGEVWQQNVSIFLFYYGEYRIDFDLYIQKEGSPEYFYGNLHLFV